MIRVPQFIFPILRQLGLLIKNKPVLSPRILQDFADPDLHPIAMMVKQVLGPGLDGPATVRCRCVACRKLEGQLDNTCLPGQRSAGGYAGDTGKLVADIKRKRRFA